MRVLQRRRWRNHTRNQSCEPLAICYAETRADLVTIVQAAHRDGATVRACGSRHAWSDAALTTGFLVETHGLNRALDVERDLLQPAWHGANLVRTEAGVRVRELNERLARGGLAFTNMGGYDGQTIAGVISTSTHGSGLRFGPIGDCVRAIELVAAQGRLFRIEPSAGLVDAARFRDRHPDIELVQDDEWFNATLVSMGCFGIIYAVTIEVEPRFWLKETRTIHTWAQVRGQLSNRDVLEHDNRHYEVCLNPHGENATNRCLVTTRNLAAEPRRRPPDKRRRNVLTELVSPLPIVHFLLDRLFTRHPRVTPWAIDKGLDALRDDEYTNLSYKVLNIGAANFIPAYSSEIAVPLEDDQHIEAVERIIAIANSRARVGRVYHTAPIALRFVKASDAHLSMMQGRDTMVIELIMMTNTEGGMELLATYEDALYELSGRPHWGQLNWLTDSYDLVSRLYPRLDAWLVVRQQLDPSGLFDSPFTKRTGLSLAAAVRA
jgi:L-gulono-1,4-lactone dehydrogenase